MHSFQKYLIIFFISSVNAELITVDGNLDEAAWGNASEINEYFETVPFTLKPARVKTITKIFSNESGIYIGFKNRIRCRCINDMIE